MRNIHTMMQMPDMPNKLERKKYSFLGQLLFPRQPPLVLHTAPFILLICMAFNYQPCVALAEQLDSDSAGLSGSS